MIQPSTPHWQRTRRLFCAVALAAASALSLLLGTAAADQLADIKAAHKLRVAIDLAVPPYGMKDAQLRSTGSDVETAELLAKDLGVALEIVPVTGANRIPFLQTDKADIVISSLSITPERAKVIEFSLPYAGISSVIAAPKAMTIKDAADLKGKKIATARGTTNDQEVTKILPEGAQLIRYDDDATSITAIVSGQAEVFATAPALLQTVNQKNPALAMEPKFVMKVNMLGMGLRKDEPQLKATLDDWVKRRMADGQLNTIYRKFHGADLPEQVSKPAS